MRVRRPGARASLVVALLLSLLLVGCILPGALAEADRLPSWDHQVDSGTWRAVCAEDLVGSFESVEICGDISACFLRIAYCFEADGSYQGEAVLLFENGPATREISGTWSLTSGRLHLGDGSEPAEVVTDGCRLRLAASLGAVVLERTN